MGRDAATTAAPGGRSNGRLSPVQRTGRVPQALPSAAAAGRLIGLVSQSSSAMF